MVAISIIALIISLLVIIARLILIHLFKNIEYISNMDLNKPENFQKAVHMCYGKPEEIYSDAMVICTERQAAEKSIIYDFSLWDTKKIVGITYMHPDVEYDEDEEPHINIIPKQKIYRYKDGTILWSPLLQ